MRRHIIATYEKVKSGVGENPESPRKRFCLAYLEFKVKLNEESKAKYVEAAKEFRKAERKVGRLHRTRLEKLARKHFYDVAKRKRLQNSWKAGSEFAQRQYENGEGIHAPEQRALRADRNREIYRRMSETGFAPIGQIWVLTTPDGHSVCIYSLGGFCRKVKLDRCHMVKTALNQRRMHWGYKAAHLDLEFHSGLKFLDWRKLPSFDARDSSVRLSELVDWDSLPYIDDVVKENLYEFITRTA